MPELRHLSMHATVSPDAGTISGLASPFGQLNWQGSIILPGAFAATLERFLERGWLAIDHSTEFANAVGYFTKAAETKAGLEIEAAFHSDPGAQMIRQRIAERVNSGKFVGLSIGFTPSDYESVPFADAVPYLSADPMADAEVMFPHVELIRAVETFEVSVVTLPAADAAQITAVNRRHQAPPAPAPAVWGLADDLAYYRAILSIHL